MIFCIPWNLVPCPIGGCSSCHLPLRVQGHHPDGVVVAGATVLAAVFVVAALVVVDGVVGAALGAGVGGYCLKCRKELG